MHVPVLFVFAYKETSGQPEGDEKVKNEITTWLHVQAAEFCDIGIQKPVQRLNKCLDQGYDYVEK
jgi:hypothetical protein